MSLSLNKIFSKAFPAPIYLDIPYVGLDISSNSIKFIEIKKTNKDFRVGKFDLVKFTKPFVMSEDLSTLEEVANVLKKWKKEHKINFIEVSLPEEKAYLYKTEVPAGKDADMRQAVEFGLEENVPISPADTIFDYRAISASPSDSTKARVVVTALPQVIVQNYMTLFESCGLTPISFMIEAQALAKAIIKKDDLNTYLVVNIGELKTGIFIVSSGVVQFTSTLTVGGRDFNNALMKQFSITYEEADQIKKNKGFEKSEENKETFEALINTASVFREEIEKIYIYWKTHGDKDDPTKVDIHKIILCGKDSLMTGFKEYLGQSLRVGTEIGNVWTNVASFDQYIPPINSHDSLDYGVAIGLALPKLN